MPPVQPTHDPSHRIAASAGVIFFLARNELAVLEVAVRAGRLPNDDPKVVDARKIYRQARDSFAVAKFHKYYLPVMLRDFVNSGAIQGSRSSSSSGDANLLLPEQFLRDATESMAGVGVRIMILEARGDGQQ